jgi:hypothetical protein
VSRRRRAPKEPWVSSAPPLAAVSGLLTRGFGMASDKLLAAEVVVASGSDGAEAIIVDEQNNSDLLWALRKNNR